jgi:ankyrin repeat protein
VKNRKKSLILLLLLFAAGLQGQRNPATEMLAKASRLGDLKSAETLVSAGVDPNLPNRSGRTPLYYAALFNRNEVAALLLAHAADPNIRAGSGAPDGEFPQTPLQIASAMGNLHLASMLTAAGARVDAKAGTGRTALHFAVVGSHLDIIRFLLEKGADINARDADGTSPLDDAAWRGHLEAAAILLAKGARLNEAETKTGATPINEAAYRGQTQLVRYLLQFGPNLAIPDKRGYIPLENAIRMGNADPALLLLEAAAQEQKTPDFLNKMLGAAVKKDESIVVEALLQQGARANDTLASGATPLDAAASEGAVKIVRVLLNAGANPNRIGRDGTSPLEDACLKGFYSIAEMLLDNGALVNQVNGGSGRTALYAASSFGKSDVVNLLLKRGADPNICGKGQGSPYKTALENGYSEIAAQLQRHGGSRGCKPEQIPVK